MVSDEQRQTLGAELAILSAIYPVDEVEPPGRRVLLDTEWKLRANGTLAITQVRPFLD